VDDPADLLEACRMPLFAFNTNEPRRALATRALVKLAPEDRGPYPLQVPALEIEGVGESGVELPPHGEWSGRFELGVRVRNPFSFPVKAALALVVRGGAFQVAGLPTTLALDARDEQGVAVTLHGGSWSPLEDPSVVVRLAWRRGREGRALVLDAPLERVRTLRLGASAQRVLLLRERPSDPPATMTVRRRGQELLAAVELSGGLEDVAAKIRVGARVRSGRRAVRIRLPEEEDPDGLPFCVGFEGREPETGLRRMRRFSGGLPYGLGSGAPGRLFLASRA
jgi:hypothetical protein